MNWGIFVVKTQPDKFLVFERVEKGIHPFTGPTGKTRYLFTTSSYSVIQMRYPLHELLEMPRFFSASPIDSLTGGACGPGKDRCYIFDPCKNHRQQPKPAAGEDK